MTLLATTFVSEYYVTYRCSQMRRRGTCKLISFLSRTPFFFPATALALALAWALATALRDRAAAITTIILAQMTRLSPEPIK